MDEADVRQKARAFVAKVDASDIRQDLTPYVVEANAKVKLLTVEFPTFEALLAESPDLIAAADFVVCNDSGLMHVAAALNRPLVAVYGSTSPQFTPPLADQVEIVQIGRAHV